MPEVGARIQGFVSRASDPAGGRASGDRQFLYVNGRPVDLPKATKVRPRREVVRRSVLSNRGIPSGGRC